MCARCNIMLLAASHAASLIMRRGWFGGFVATVWGGVEQGADAVYEYAHLLFEFLNFLLLRVELLAEACDFFVLMPDNGL